VAVHASAVNKSFAEYTEKTGHARVNLQLDALLAILEIFQNETSANVSQYVECLLRVMIMSFLVFF